MRFRNVQVSAHAIGLRIVQAGAGFEVGDMVRFGEVVVDGVATRGPRRATLAEAETDAKAAMATFVIVAFLKHVAMFAEDGWS